MTDVGSFRSDQNSMFEEHSYVPQTRSLKLQYNQGGGLNGL